MKNNYLTIPGSKKSILMHIIITVLMNIFVFSALSETLHYESHGRRDPFVPLIGVERPSALKLEDITSVEDVRLEGIALGSKGEYVAILNGDMVREGAKFGDIVIAKIYKNGILITLSGKEYSVRLPEEGGKKE